MDSNKNSPKDAELVARIKAGDKPAMEELIRRYSNKVYSLAVHLTGSTPAAEEVMQEVFLSVITKIDTLENNDYFSTWLYRITANASYGYLRKNKKNTKNISVDEIKDDRTEIHDWSSLPEDVLVSKETGEIINKAILKLPKSMRTIVVMKDMEGFKNEEIAETLNLSLAAVKSRLHRGRLVLKDELSKHFADYYREG